MAVERVDPSTVAIAGGNAEQLQRAIESDFRIRSGLCPNGCGLMAPNAYGQECPACCFSCNTHAEQGTSQ